MAVGSGNLDHTPVIDWYLKELTDLMKGKNYYCGQRKITLHAKIGVVAVLADRPEKAFVLKTSLLGIHGRIASWATDIDPDILSDCNKCFKKRLSQIFNDRHSCSNMNVCHDCCQWNLDSTSASVKRIAAPCGMHLVFHGIVAYCVERIEEFMVDQGLTQKFERLVNTYLIDIQALRLDWCKMNFCQKNNGLQKMSSHLQESYHLCMVYSS